MRHEVDVKLQVGALVLRNREMATGGSIYGFGSCPVDPVGPVYGLFVNSIFHFPLSIIFLPFHFHTFTLDGLGYDITQVYLRSL